MLDEHFVDLVEEIANTLVVPRIVNHYESNLACRDEGRHKPLIELVDGLQVHGVGLPLVLVDEIEGRVCDKLIEMPVVLFL